jgi:ADP-heptose:LPS heptosyltransferase
MLEALEYWWRHLIVYPVLRRVFHNLIFKAPIDIHSVKNILILRYDRIGDMIVTTPIFRGLKEKNPQLQIGVFASEANAEIIRNNHNVDRIYILSASWRRMLSEIRRARNDQYDVVLNFVFNRTTSGAVLANLIAPHGIKIGQGDAKYGFYYNILLSLKRTTDHMVDILAWIIKAAFNIDLDPDHLTYEVVTDRRTKDALQAFWTTNQLRPRSHEGYDGVPYIVFNLSANDTVRRISADQALALGKQLSTYTKYRTVLVHAPNDAIMAKTKQELLNTTHCLPFPMQGTATLLELAELIAGAQAVITPDTSIVHFASAAKTPILAFYTSMQDVHEWLL